jgi:hypothetical protein
MSTVNLDRLSADARFFEKSATDVSRVGSEFWTDWLLMQPKMPSIPKNGYNSFSKYHYVLYEDLVSAIMETLPQFGFGYTQLLGTGPRGDTVLTTVIFHKSGQFLTTTAPVPQVALTAANAAQQTGAGIQYLRRYMLVTALGIVSDEDVDGQPDPSKRQAGASPRTPSTSTPSPVGGDASFVADEILVNSTAGGKLYLMFKQIGAGRNGPAAAWFKGRTALRETAPWVVSDLTDEDLHSVGEVYEIPDTQVQAVFNEKGYRDITGLSLASDDKGEVALSTDDLWKAAFQANSKLDTPLSVPSRFPGMKDDAVRSAARSLLQAVKPVASGKRSREQAQAWLDDQLKSGGYLKEHKRLAADAEPQVPDF